MRLIGINLALLFVVEWVYGEPSRFDYEKPVSVEASIFGKKYSQDGSRISDWDIAKEMHLHYPDSYAGKAKTSRMIAVGFLAGTGALLFATSDFNRGINYPMSPRIFIDLSAAAGIRR